MCSGVDRSSQSSRALSSVPPCAACLVCPPTLLPSGRGRPCNLRSLSAYMYGPDLLPELPHGPEGESCHPEAVTLIPNPCFHFYSQASLEEDKQGKNQDALGKLDQEVEKLDHESEKLDQEVEKLDQEGEKLDQEDGKLDQEGGKLEPEVEKSDSEASHQEQHEEDKSTDIRTQEAKVRPWSSNVHVLLCPRVGVLPLLTCLVSSHRNRSQSP